MVDLYLEPNGNPEHDRQIRDEFGYSNIFLRGFLKVIFTIFFVSALLLGNVVIFHNLYYKSFFVNGQSMYPTLNGGATCLDGSPIGAGVGSTCSDHGTTVEYGIMDTHELAKKSIRRFDIIIGLFPNTTTKDVIKRVVALPGESFYLINDFGGPTNGDLYIIPPGETEGQLIPQNFGSEDIIRGGHYIGDRVPTINHPMTLADNQYYVLGDNRVISKDSRSTGPLIYEDIKGVAVALEGTCVLDCSSTDGSCKATNVRFHWPVSLRWRGE
ncbi:MAG: signal peptidase I [Bacilli bacterium]|jgi:signal peptidase I